MIRLVCLTTETHFVEKKNFQRKCEEFQKLSYKCCAVRGFFGINLQIA